MEALWPLGQPTLVFGHCHCKNAFFFFLCFNWISCISVCVYCHVHSLGTVEIIIIHINNVNISAWNINIKRDKETNTDLNTIEDIAANDIYDTLS